jgi:hypothetical protein
LRRVEAATFEQKFYERSHIGRVVSQKIRLNPFQTI